MSALVLVALLGAFGVGYAGGRFHGERRRQAAALPAALPAAVLAEHVETFREVIRATDGAVSPEIEAALGRMLATPAPQPRLSDAEMWRAFAADFGPETSYSDALALLQAWSRRIAWNGDRRMWVLKQMQIPAYRRRAREIIDATWNP